MKSTMLDLKTLTDEQRYKIERILHPRNRVFSYNFDEGNIDIWKCAAKRAKYENLGDWIEHVLCEHLGPLPEEGIEPGARTHRLSLRFSEKSMDSWREKAAANKVSFTEWVERVLNEAAAHRHARCRPTSP